jgi:hypothetical protein
LKTLFLFAARLTAQTKHAFYFAQRECEASWPLA